jgi:hypothetical protein
VSVEEVDLGRSPAEEAQRASSHQRAPWPVESHVALSHLDVGGGTSSAAIALDHGPKTDVALDRRRLRDVSLERESEDVTHESISKTRSEVLVVRVRLSRLLPGAAQHRVLWLVYSRGIRRRVGEVVTPPEAREPVDATVRRERPTVSLYERHLGGSDVGPREASRKGEHTANCITHEETHHSHTTTSRTSKRGNPNYLRAWHMSGAVCSLALVPSTRVLELNQ